MGGLVDGMEGGPARAAGVAAFGDDKFFKATAAESETAAFSR